MPQASSWVLGEQGRATLEGTVYLSQTVDRKPQGFCWLRPQTPFTVPSNISPAFPHHRPKPLACFSSFMKHPQPSVFPWPSLPIKLV